MTVHTYMQEEKISPRLASSRKKADKAEPFFDSILAFLPEIEHEHEFLAMQVKFFQR